MNCRNLAELVPHCRVKGLMRLFKPTFQFQAIDG